MKNDLRKMDTNWKRVLIAAIWAVAMMFPIHHFADESDAESDSMNDSTQNNQTNLEQPLPPASPPKKRVSLIQIGGNYTYVYIKPEDSSTFTGNMGGIQAMYEYQPMNNFYAGLKAMWREGNTEASEATRSLFDFDVHERVGYTYGAWHQRYWLTFFTGFGYRYLGQTLKQSGRTLKSNYNEFYVPVGVLINLKFKPFFAAGLNAIWMPQVDTTVNLIPIDHVQWETKRRIGNVLVELPLTFYWGAMRQYLFILKPFYEFWQDGPTTAVTSFGVPLGLPGNTYNFFGAEANFGFQF